MRDDQAHSRAACRAGENPFGGKAHIVEEPLRRRPGCALALATRNSPGLPLAPRGGGERISGREPYLLRRRSFLGSRALSARDSARASALDRFRRKTSRSSALALLKGSTQE